MTSPMIPTPFIYVTDSSKIKQRLERRGDFSAHVYIAYGNSVIMLHSLRHGNVMGAGGKLDPNETVLAGLIRELNEEIPVLTEFIASRLQDKTTVAMWRQTNAGVHNTFLIEANSIDFDVWEKRVELQAAIEREKATQNRPDYLEADGGLVLVPIEELSNLTRDGNPEIECRTGPNERCRLPLRNVIVPVVSELKLLVQLARSPEAIRVAFGRVQLFYNNFAGNTIVTMDDAPISRICVSCGTNRAIQDDFAKSRYTIMCNLCGNKHAAAIRELRRIEEEKSASLDLTVVACAVIEHYE